MKPRRKLSRREADRDVPLATRVPAALLDRARDVIAYARKVGASTACLTLQQLVELGLEHAIAHNERVLTGGKRVPRRRAELATRVPSGLVKP